MKIERIELAIRSATMGAARLVKIVGANEEVFDEDDVRFWESRIGVQLGRTIAAFTVAVVATRRGEAVKAVAAIKAARKAVRTLMDYQKAIKAALGDMGRDELRRLREALKDFQLALGYSREKGGGLVLAVIALAGLGKILKWW